MPTTPNMNLDLPVVGVTVDPTWATEINAAFDDVDEHDHSTGKGVPVPTDGLNINASLSFQSNDATNLRSVALNNNVSTLPSGDIRALYASGGNLYYNNNSGNPVRITNGSSLDTGSLALNVWALHELAGNLTILSSDAFVFINTNTAATRTITLPAASDVTAGRYFIIKDKTGSANTNNITVTPAGADTIDGVAASTTLNIAYGSLTLVSDGVSGWLTNASLGGFVKIGGDLLGTGSTTLAPRVSGLTGIAGLVTMANNTALNTRNLANDTNVNLVKMNASNVAIFGDTAFSALLTGTAVTLAATTTAVTVGATTSINLLAGTDVSIIASDDISLAAIDTLSITAKNGVNVIQMDSSEDMYVGQDGYDIDVDGYNINIVSQNNTLVGSSGSMRLACSDEMLVEAGNLSIGTTTTISLSGQLMVPAKAVTGSTYTVDTTTNDYIILVDTTSSSGCTITLPTATTGRTLVIKGVNDLTSKPITLARAGGTGSIEAVAANYVMDGSYQGITLCAYGGDWFIVSTS